MLKSFKIFLIFVLPMGLGFGCRLAGIRMSSDPSGASPISDPVGVPEIRQSVSFINVGSTEMASESYRGFGSIGFFSQDVSQNVSFLMLGPSLAVETSVSPSAEGSP